MAGCVYTALSPPPTVEDDAAAEASPGADSTPSASTGKTEATVKAESTADTSACSQPAFSQPAGLFAAPIQVFLCSSPRRPIMQKA